MSSDSVHLKRARQLQARLDQRSLALHEIAARKIIAHPELLAEVVRPSILRFLEIHRGTGTEVLIREWERAAQLGIDAVVAICRDESERGQQLRSASCVSGILTPVERAAVYSRFPAV